MEKIGFSTRYMDPSRDPINDFYLYSCGRWISTHPVPSDKASIGSFVQLNDRNDILLKKIAEKCADSKNEQDTVKRIVGDFYASFMDTDTIEKLKFEPIEKLMHVVDDIKNFQDVNTAFKKLMLHGIAPFFYFESAEDRKDSSIYSLYVEQGGLSLPNRDYYLDKKNSKVLKEFEFHIQKMFKLYGMNAKDAAFHSASVMKIEKYLAKASRTEVELRDEIKNYNRFTKGKVAKRFDNLDINGLYKAIGASPSKFIVIGQPEFLDKVNRISKVASVNEIKAYFRWNVISAHASLLHSEASLEHFDFFGKKLIGIKKQRPRWKRGVSFVDAFVGEALGELYVKENFGLEARKQMEELVKDIKSIFRNRLENISWMSQKTKKESLKKFSKLNVKIGHPKKFINYSSVKGDRKDVVGNMQRAVRFELKRHMRRIGKKVDKKEWLMTPPTVNAYYNPSKNELVFPAGILQPPFFDDKLDAAVNYGGIGGVIAHEITHGYDDQGRLYDGTGKLHKWWTEDDEKKFKKLADKVASFYSSIEILPGLKVNGKLTLGENIADIGAVGIAYDALQRHLSRHPEDNRKVDGFTPQQRFYISWAQVWKRNITNQAAKMLILSDPHSPGSVRGSIPVVTHPKFVETFTDKRKSKSSVRKYPKLNMW